MAKVTFRRGGEDLYKERWQDYNVNGNQEYAYLKNAIYFAQDTQKIYMDGLCYSLDIDVDFDNILTDVEYDAEQGSLTFSYSDIEKDSTTVYLTSISLAEDNEGLSLDVSIGENGQRRYVIGMKGVSELTLKGVSGSTDDDDIVVDGDSVANAFTKVNDSLVWRNIADDEEIAD